jgi:hypothetical protein
VATLEQILSGDLGRLGYTTPPNGVRQGRDRAAEGGGG